MSNKDKGYVFETEDGNMDVNIDQVIELANSGDMNGEYALGMSHLFGWEVEQDIEKGYELLEKASEKGHTDAMTLLVKMYFSGEYNKMDSKKAVEYSKKASEDNIDDAQLFLGLAYMDGIEVEQDYLKAAALFRKSANQGNTEARNTLAYLYQQGLGVEKDQLKAFKLYKNAASAGNVNAQYQTGTCYEMGIGVTLNRSKAVEWYTKATEQGDAVAMDRLGILYYNNSKDLPSNPEISFKWFLDAATNGLTDSMYAIACYYMDGFGIEKNEEEAKKWLQLAISGGHESAKELLEKIKITKD